MENCHPSFDFFDLLLLFLRIGHFVFEMKETALQKISQVDFLPSLDFNFFFSFFDHLIVEQLLEVFNSLLFKAKNLIQNIRSFTYIHENLLQVNESNFVQILHLQANFPGLVIKLKAFMFLIVLKEVQKFLNRVVLSRVEEE